MTVTRTTKHVMKFDKNFPPLENSGFRLVLTAFLNNVKKISTVPTVSIGNRRTMPLHCYVMRHFMSSQLSLVIFTLFLCQKTISIIRHLATEYVKKILRDFV